jgi:hypothetical protein
MNGIARSAGIIAMATALSAMTPQAGNAQTTAPSSSEVSVAIIDLGANRLYSADPNVTFVDLTPAPKEGFRNASSKVAGRDHGEIVAQTFMQEYRRIDPAAKVTIYTINPFIEKSGGGQMMLSRTMLRQALPGLAGKDVRVAITTFGVSDEKAGNMVLDDLRSAGLVVFAATPNKRDDDGIWPAASPNAIAVADGVTPDSPIFKERGWASWVDVVANGQFHKDTIDVDGSSFATPRAAAYGVSFMSRNPKADTQDVKAALLHDGDMRTIGSARITYVGGDAMARTFASLSTSRMPGRMGSTGIGTASNDAVDPVLALGSRTPNAR